MLHVVNGVDRLPRVNPRLGAREQQVRYQLILSTRWCKRQRNKDAFSNDVAVQARAKRLQNNSFYFTNVRPSSGARASVQPQLCDCVTSKQNNCVRDLGRRLDLQGASPPLRRRTHPPGFEKPSTANNYTSPSFKNPRTFYKLVVRKSFNLHRSTSSLLHADFLSLLFIALLKLVSASALSC